MTTNAHNFSSFSPPITKGFPFTFILGGDWYKKAEPVSIKGVKTTKRS